MPCEIVVGDALEVLRAMPDCSVDCCITSPPYWGLRDYGVGGQIGLEPTLQEFLARLVDVFAEVRRVLKKEGTCWVNMGDSYANDAKWGGSSGGKHVQALHGNTGIGRGKNYTGLKPKDLVGQPWRLAFALQDAGWYLRSDIIWHKPNPMPESVRDRPTKAHEYVFLLTKSQRYWYDAEAIKEDFAPTSISRVALANSRELEESDQYKLRMGKANGRASHKDGLVMMPKRGLTGGTVSTPGQSPHGNARKQDALDKNTYTGFNDRYVEPNDGKRNARTVWSIATKPFSEAHFATFPPELARRCILAGCPEGGTVLDPFGGAGTTGLVAQEFNRNAVLIELNPEYAEIARKRIQNADPLYSEVTVR